MPKVRVTRRVHFSAAHRLHNAAFSDEENAACSACAATRTGTVTTTSWT